MMSVEEKVGAFRREMQPVLETLMEGVLSKVHWELEATEQQLAEERAEMFQVNAKVRAKVEAEFAAGFEEVKVNRDKLHRENAAMRMHQEAQEGHVELNVGGCRFETSVQTLRRISGTYFDIYFSGRYDQEVCGDGSIFVDRNGEHFGHVLEYMRDGYSGVAAEGACPGLSLLRSLKREFDFYCIELRHDVAVVAVPLVREAVLVIGRRRGDHGSGAAEGVTVSRMEVYDLSSGLWSVASSMNSLRWGYGACTLMGEVYVTGGSSWVDPRYPCDGGLIYPARLATVEKYSPATDSWTTVAPLPRASGKHSAVSVGPAMYVICSEAVILYEPGWDLPQPPGVLDVGHVYRYDSTQGTWSEVASMPEHRHMHAACAVGIDIYVLGGGKSIHDREPQASVFKYDTVENTWSTLASMPFPCYGHSASLLDGDQVYVVGAGPDCSDFLRFDTVDETWTILRATEHTVACDASVVVGGSLYTAGRQGGLTRYDAADEEWRCEPDMSGAYADEIHAFSVEYGFPTPDLFDSLITEAIAREKGVCGHSQR
jgi:hypothetical protein